MHFIWKLQKSLYPAFKMAQSRLQFGPDRYWTCYNLQLTSLDISHPIVQGNIINPTWRLGPSRTATAYLSVWHDIAPSDNGRQRIIRLSRTTQAVDICTWLLAFFSAKKISMVLGSTADSGRRSGRCRELDGNMCTTEKLCWPSDSL